MRNELKPKSLLSDRDVAARLGVGRTYVWRLVREEGLTRVKFGRRTLFPSDEIDQLIERRIADARREAA
ncbi:MAG: excisionase [Hyphomicrobium sp.]|nr:MAG: excisionase [Hyphomicrobium sp.]PPC98592.1 MAG: excisionase [Hyphomicrobium sp.]